MKHKLSSKLISVILAVIMIVSVVPVGMIQANAASGYLWPVPDSSTVSRGYSSGHKGMDISTNGRNLNAVAVANGKVVALANVCNCTGKTKTYNGWKVTCTDHRGTYGNYVRIQLDDGKYALYGHLKYNSIKVSVGQRVSRGQAIGLVGDSGVSTGIHLHFEIRGGNGSGQASCINMTTLDAYSDYSHSTSSGGGGTTPTNNYVNTSLNNSVNNAVDWAVSVANNNYYGYHYGARHGNGTHRCSIRYCNNEDFDCSSFVCSAFKQAGFNVSVTPTSSMKTMFQNAGFTWINGTGNLQRGDILLKPGSHTAIYLGNNQIVHASKDCNGAKGGSGGSSRVVSGTSTTGADEITVRTYYSFATGVLRCNYAPPTPPDATTPTINISANDIAVGKTATITYASQNAAKYEVFVNGTSRYAGSGTSFSYRLDEAKTYEFKVRAYNSIGKVTGFSAVKYCTAHNPVTVKFVDWDDTLLTSVKVTWGESAKAPDSPYRKGYTFQGWSDSYYNVKTDKIIKATYKINTYIINFFDREGVLIDSQKVTYGSDATPPTDTHATGRYQFKGWSSTDYIDVYTDRADKNINIDGIYAWDNYDLPVECTVKSAERQFDGYTVVLDIENNDSLPVTGRAVVALKTAEGKLVDMTESTAFSIKAGKTKNDLEVFLPCTNSATQAEVFMVANYSSGVPISSSDTATITRGVMYAESTVKPDNEGGTLDIQEVTQYRYRDKEKTTGNSKTLAGWTWDETRNTTKSAWSAWSWNSVSKTYNSDGLITRDVKTQSAIKSYNTKTQYRYSHWTNGKLSNGEASMSNASLHYTDWRDSAKVNRGPGNSSYNRYGDSSSVWGYCNSCGRSYFPWYNQETRQVNTSANYATQYSYMNYTYTYNFYRWKTWTDWSDTEVTASENRDVQTRKIYRYQSNVEVPEDNSGIERQYSGNLGAENAGKQVTLYVYGYTGASDYTNEYIGQTTVESDGHYSFTYKLREEPTMKTGNFTVAIGVEGTSDIKVVDTIEAPKPVYTVNFYDWDGSIISTQQITKGENATPPTNPTKEGFKFLGWDKSVTNITEDTDIFADFEREQYTVVFVDWENQTIKMEKFNYGDILVPPEAEEVEGYDFIGWDAIENGKQYVTEDMIVTAQYAKKEYTVRFHDVDNTVFDTQIVSYDEEAFAPSILTEDENYIFAGWYDPEKFENVKSDVDIYPAYIFEETTENPTANYESGEYTDNIQLALATSDENAVIYYYLNGDEANEKIYTKPITISKTCSVTYHAESLGKNNSDEATQYYCINTSDKPSEWMIYNDLPDEVKNNPADFTVEQEIGYSYKDVETTSSSERAGELMDDNWSLAGVTYTDYTQWQDEPIANDSSKIGFEIETGEAPDPTKVRYQYSHYKYTEDGVVKYSPKTVEGFNCQYEDITIDSKLNVSGFVEIDGVNTGYYTYNGQQWFNRTQVTGVKPQYRSRYQIAEYYKWTAWSVETPSAFETREQKSDNVYRYYNKNYHIVTVVNDFEEKSNSYLIEHSKLFDTKDIALDGHNLEGLYTDAELTHRFSTSTPITESMTLYANFTPKQYTVTFQMQDGTELDTQTVDFMTAATAPDTDSVPGWVFAGWDKDFSCITEDTVVTGRYVRESEYARISLPRSTYNMYTSTNISLVPTITPENLSDSKVEWTSSDPSIASVDDKGNVTAVSAGEATITATVVSSREKAECKVIVKADLATTILLKSNSKLNYDDLGFLRRIKYRTDVDTVTAEFENTDLAFYNVDGTKLAGTDFVGTGSQVKLLDGDNVIDSKTVVVTGDLNGDGIINNRDVAVMNRYVAELLTLEDYQVMAFDANGDGSINNRDVALIARFLVGKEAL